VIISKKIKNIKIVLVFFISKKKMNMNNIQFPKENNKSINYKLILQYLIKNDIFFKIKKFEYVISFNEDSFFKEHQDELIITQEPN